MNIIKILLERASKKNCDYIDKKLELYVTDKKEYYNNEIRNCEKRIEHLKTQIELFSKENPNSHINDDAKLITYGMAISIDNSDINGLEKYIKKCKKELRKIQK